MAYNYYPGQSQYAGDLPLPCQACCGRACNVLIFRRVTRGNLLVCKRPSLALQKLTFRKAKDKLLQRRAQTAVTAVTGRGYGKSEKHFV